MEELVRQLLGIARGMWRFRWLGVLVAWIVAIVGGVVVFQIPDRYEADARLYVDTQSILKPLMSGLAVQPNVDQQVGMLSRTLISRPNIEKLIRMADLDLKDRSKAQQDALVESLMKELKINITGGNNLYTLSFRDADPAKAKRVVQSLVSIFVESSLGASRKDTDQAKVFLGEQIKAYERKLEEAEAKLLAFRLRNVERQAADGSDAASSLSGIATQLDQAKLELREAENARDQVKAQLEGEKSSSASIATQSLLQESAISISTPEIDARIAGLKSNLDALLPRFTEQHPDIISIRRLIEDLEEQKRKEVQEKRLAAAAMPTASSNNRSVAYQELSRMLAVSEVQVAALRARVAEYQARLNQARERMKTAPQVQAEAAQLNRDYDINKKNYQDLVARRQSAVMSGELDDASGVADFRLIDPPRVSPKPVWPNRTLYLLLALLAALAAGTFSAFAGSQLRPVFLDAGALRDKIKLPVLGVVSMVVSDTQRKRERASLMRFLAACGSLLGVFGAGLAAMAIMAGR
ncbi:MAG: Wzz/FepE/Etk N-terminal domain-containing protein [Burkholderiaceae bacterium]|nr:Wzz/FepE/Etk N-terminal domain-containing protein [Burkholderiaceae bacterium]MDH3459924.1 Wzz/FepE/Etk N-terminal domain-containing protein [Burkholderiaceae bacterium]